MAISDALVSVFETKYFYAFWRPVTAIRAGDTDGNPRTEPDTAWTPFITTPSFPGYPSAHASGSGAARRVAELLYGPFGHAITLSHPAVPDVTLQYTNFRDITDDIDDARVYGGIHFRFDQEAGSLQGRRVGRYVLYAQSPACAPATRVMVPAESAGGHSPPLEFDLARGHRLADALPAKRRRGA